MRNVWIIAAVVGLSVVTWAKKGGNGNGGGGGGGGGDGDVLTGRVYFQEQLAYPDDADRPVRSMDADGTVVADEDVPTDHFLLMSNDRHGGDYWVLGVVVDESADANPNGSQPSYIVARRSDGAGGVEEVALTTPADGGESVGWPQFGKDDGFISYIANRWPGGVQANATKNRLYKASITWNATTSQPEVTSETEIMSVAGITVRGWDWSSDGSELVLSLDGEIVAVDSSGGETVIADGIFPRWSPDDSRIAFRDGPDTPDPLGGSLYVISASGGSAAKLVDESAIAPYSAIDWTPDSAHVVFTSVKRRRGTIPLGLGSENHDVGRVPVSGGRVTLISNTKSADEYLVAWRAD